MTRPRPVLAATHHDPDGRLLEQTRRILPTLRELCGGVAVLLTPQSVPEAAAALRDGGASVAVGDPTMPVGHLHLGLWRRRALAHGLERHPEAGHILFCDLDRALHWAERHAGELRATLEAIEGLDCCVLGRTARAYGSHPRAQRDTEALANRCFALVSGLEWDVMAAARGLSAAAAELIVRACADDSVGSDCTWPLLARAAGMRVGYLATEGLEFETLDRYGDEVAALGGAAAWLERFDADPGQWLARTALAQAEMAAAIAYGRPAGPAT